MTRAIILVAGRGLAALAAILICWAPDEVVGAQTAAPDEAPRIVSLAPHLTELAFDAGIGDALVGVVEWSDYPAAAASLPRIGDAFRFDLEQVLRLGTTHALAWAGGTPSGAIAELEALGVVVEIIEIGTLEQIGTAMERLGGLGGNPGVAGAAAASYRARLSRFRDHSGPERAPVSIFYQVSARPLFTLGAKHVINEVFALCGAVNVFDDLDTEAASVDLEAVLSRDPSAIVIGGEEIVESGLQWTAYPELRAVACDNILHVDPALLVRPTPRVLDGARKLCAWIDAEVERAGDTTCSASAR